ncbi:Transcriptional regulator, ArsR family [Fulvivirga imtechensis AK7]|uniref:Transcriptional regulator, ArsR family n=1 Tax=Fulvivirga imtechensis AK7 TaxID=1237149 RepID=L8JID0_9BACT|nr:metalloregulator ArsR/SmtB family transcription factor [Fulvivirga imtechensis]ELR68008.1 Transcriptional regulator, ArsR family [Fulvivirga imtechensis AK7]
MNIANYDSFLAIADPHRREILMMLSKEKLPMNSIADRFDISRPAISRHVRVLHATGFIDIEEKGRERICMLNQAGFNEIQDWMDHFEKYWISQLQSLDEFLKKNESINNKKE